MCVFMNVHYISVESGMQHVAAVSINSFVSSELFFGEEGGGERIPMDHKPWLCWVSLMSRNNHFSRVCLFLFLFLFLFLTSGGWAIRASVDG